MSSSQVRAKGFAPHDHAACIQDALSAAQAACATRRVQLTPVRQRTLEILLESHAALGAYEILKRLETDGFGAKPPVAYRALAFLVEQGFVHRIERLNAFVACVHPDTSHDPAFMICRNCGTVAEAQATGAMLDASAATTGFHIEQTVVEAEGLCAICQETPA